MNMSNISRVIAWIVAGSVLSGCGTLDALSTPGQRFRSDLASLERNCKKNEASRTPGDVSCAVLEVQPRDWSQIDFVKVDGQPLPIPKSWVETDEGAYAHSIKLPNPLPADSGYRPGMSSEQYFNHLCKQEAGAFVYKQGPAVDRIFQIRARSKATHDQLTHLYGLEDPGGIAIESSAEFPWTGWIGGPGSYQYFESSYVGQLREVTTLRSFHESMKADAPAGMKVSRYYDVGGNDWQYVRREFLESPASQYGYVWRGLRREMDREMGIAGGELLVLDLSTNEVIGLLRYFRRVEFIDRRLGVFWTYACNNLMVEGTYPPRHIGAIRFVSSILKNQTVE